LSKILQSGRAGGPAETARAPAPRGGGRRPGHDCRTSSSWRPGAPSSPAQ